MREIKKEADGRGNVILLTVIAIVTMIIVVVGATFAYLASSVQSGDISNINATTEGGSDLLLINAGEDLSLVANLDNFNETAGNLTGQVDANVLLQTNNKNEVTYDYRVYLTVPNNDFEYTSGMCYVKPATDAIVVDNQEDCLADSSSNVWATVDGTGFACYASPTQVVNAFYTNEITCLSNPNYMWSQSNIAELVLDLYQSTGESVEKATCEAQGVCVSNTRTIVGGVTTSADCKSNNPNNTWLPNISENGLCYGVIKTADLTTLTTTEGTNLSLIDSVSIKATDGQTKHYYKGIVTLINFGHNQIVNGNKAFNGSLNFERIIPSQNSVVD
ncbi:MAG: hypothetical protein E7164_01730 [Firmicutes bacterium]|nr:hypothetical protein [Bacillota bacterium]